MQTHPNEYILYESMGYDRDHIIQAWIDSRGVRHLLYDYLFELKIARDRHNNRQTTYRITNKTAHLLKKIPRTHHLRLKFESNTSLDYLELRKLGLFSKKAFRSLKGLSLDYSDCQQYQAQTLKKRHMCILGNHMGRNLRKLQHLAIQFEFWRVREAVDFGPLLTRIKRNFASLVSLKLSLRKSFKINVSVVLNFERMFVMLRPTLKHLDLDFSGNESNEISDFPEGLAILIANRLPKLESLALNFSHTQFSTKIIRLLFRAACTHLCNLTSLGLDFEGCRVVEEHWNSYPKHFLASKLEFLRLNLENCKALNREYLYILRGEIISMCPLLNGLSLSTLDCLRIPDSFYFHMEREFALNLRCLKRLKILYSHEQEINWNRCQELLALQFQQEIKMEEEIKRMEVEDRKMKAKAGGEEVLQLYYQTTMEEEQVLPKDQEFDEIQYLENEWLAEQEEFEKAAIFADDENWRLFDAEMDKRQVSKDCEFDDYIQYLENEMSAEQDFEKGIILAEIEGQAIAYCATENREVKEIQQQQMLENIYRQMEIEQAAVDLTEAEIRREWGG